jgi:hypothetical protein
MSFALIRTVLFLQLIYRPLCNRLWIRGALICDRGGGDLFCLCLEWYDNENIRRLGAVCVGIPCNAVAVSNSLINLRRIPKGPDNQGTVRSALRLFLETPTEAKQHIKSSEPAYMRTSNQQLEQFEEQKLDYKYPSWSLRRCRVLKPVQASSHGQRLRPIENECVQLTGTLPNKPSPERNLAKASPASHHCHHLH